MKTLETDDPVKAQLLRQAAREQEELKGEVKDISERTEKILTNALLIGGALALTYFLVRGFSGSKSKRKAKREKVRVKKAEANQEETFEPEEFAPPSILSQIGSAVATQATVLLLDLAKEKLIEYLQAQAQKKADERA